MHFVSFIITLVFLLLTVLLIGNGLVKLQQNKPVRARSLMSSGLTLGLWGIVISVLVFNIFNV